MRFYLISLVLHLAFLLAIKSLSPNQISPIQDQPTSEDPPKKISIQIQPKPSKPPKSTKGGLVHQESTKSDCKDFYYGVGVMIDYITPDLCMITKVAKGSPADLAGLKPNDLLATENPGCAIRGQKEGTKVTISVTRDNLPPFHLTLTRTKICQQQLLPLPENPPTP